MPICHSSLSPPVQRIATDHQPFSTLLLHAGTVAKVSDMLSLAKTGELYPLRIEKIWNLVPLAKIHATSIWVSYSRAATDPHVVHFQMANCLRSLLASIKRRLRACMY